MTWSSSAGTTDPRFSLEQITGPGAVDQRYVAADTGRPQVPAAVRAGVIPVAVDPGTSAEAPRDSTGRADDSATSLERIKRLDIAALSPHADSWSSFESPRLVSPPPPPPLAAKPVIHRSREQVCDTVANAAHANNLPAPFFIRLLFQESRFNPASVSPAGALGIAQFMPGTAADVGLENPFDPVQAITASARLLRTLVAQFGNVGLAAAAYNAGPRRIQDWLNKKTRLPAETAGYVKVITGHPAENWKKMNAGAPQMRLPRRAPCQETAGLYAWNGPAEIPLPRLSPRREAERRIAAARQEKRKVERKMAALTAMKSAIKYGKGSVQLAARRHEKSKQRKKK